MRNHDVTPVFAIFIVNGVKLKRVLSSLYCFSDKNKLRIFLVKSTESDWFNTFVMTAILLNSVVIAMEDKSLKDTQRNEILANLSILFTIIYTMEAVAKIIASGFIFGINTYLKDPINVLDFCIVISSLLEIVTLSYATEFIFMAKYFRILRTLRMLKLISVLYKI